MKTLLVPQCDIDNVEEAREQIYKLISNIEKGIVKPENAFVYVTNITQPIWYLAHRRYKESLWSKIKNYREKK